MQRLEEFKNNNDLHWLRNMFNEYSDMYCNQVDIVLDKTNGSEFDINYKKLLEIKSFRKVIEETIEEVNCIILK